MANPNIPPFDIAHMSLNDRLKAADTLSDICKERGYQFPEYCHLVWAARKFWGDDLVDEQPSRVRRSMYLSMQWCLYHRTQIIHHIAWRDSDSVSNVWMHIEKPEYATYGGYDNQFYNEEETRLYKRLQKHKNKNKKQCSLTMWDFM